MNYKKQILLSFLVFLIYLIRPQPAQADCARLRNLRIAITPQRPASYQGTDVEFLANPTYIQREQANFSVTFTREVRWWWFRLRLPVYIPPECIGATFPNSDTGVTLNHLFWGYYTYTSPVLTEVGNNNHTLGIVVSYTLRFSIFGRTYRIPIPMAIAQKTISVAQRPLDIEITTPIEGAVLNTNPLPVSGTIDDNDAIVTINGTPATVSDNSFSIEIPVVEGENIITAHAENEFGTTDIDTVAVTIDTIAPQNPSININEGAYANTATINLTLSAEGADEMVISEDPGFLGAVWEAYIEAKTFTLSEGDASKAIYVKYRDTVQNETSSVSDSIILDTTLPQLEILSPVAGSITSQTQTNISGTFTEVNLDTITVNGLPAVIEGNSYMVEGIPLDLEGNNLIRIEAVDLARNSNIYEINVIRDTLPPEIQITNPPNNFLTNQLQVDITGTFTEANLDTITVNGTAAAIDGNTFSAEGVQLNNEGDNPIRAIITDLTGQTNSYEINIVRDTTPPTGSVIINNNAEYTNSGLVTLTLSAIDTESGVAEMQLSNDNVDWSSPEPYNTTKDWAIMSGDGEKTVYARFRNGAGAWSDVVSDSIILDTTPPQARITIPEDNFNTTQDSAVIWGEVDDNEANITVNGISAIVGNNQFSVNEIPLQSGLNLITAIATDPLGNTSTNSINVNLSNLPPAEILVDDFSDGETGRNNLGFQTSDNQTCRENVDIAGQHKISWDNNASYWYSNLWDSNSLPTGTNTSHYERLTFKVRGDNGGEDFSIELEDIPHGINFNKRIEISSYINITTDWKEVTIPLKDFTIQGVWETQARSIVFHFDGTPSGTIYIDDIKFSPSLIDNFVDNNPGINSLGYPTGDDGTLVENIDVDGYHKFQWDSNTDYWWSSLWDGTDEFNASGFGYIYMRIKGENGGEDFSLELQDNVIGDPVEISNYITIDRTWRYVYIPLGDFSVDRSKLQRLILRFNRIPAGTIYIDKIGITSTNGSANAKPQSNGPVKIISRQLLVNNSPFHVRGIVYQPTPIGTAPNMNNALYQDENIYNRDIPLLRELGCNTIRTFKKLNSHDFLNACYNNGIYVIMGFPINYIDLDNPGVRELLRQEFMEYVREYKDEPGVLMWALGNEINMTYEGNIQDWYSLANELARIAYEVEGDFYHPVMIVNRDIEDIGGQGSFSTDEQLNYIDLWGINAYRGYTYRGFFTDYSQISAKPILVTEYGADSWHSGIIPSQGYSDPHTQGEYYLNNWNEIKNSVGCIGGVLMEYTDEWWKLVGGNYNVQDYGGFDNRYDQPDNFSNEEFWGLFKIQDNGDNPDILIPRKAYEVMRLGFDNLSYPEMILAWEFNTDTDPEGWTQTNSLDSFIVEGGLLYSQVTGSDPLMDSPDGLSINGLLYSGVEIRLRVDNGSMARLYWKREGEPDFSSENSRDFLLFRDGVFHTHYIYLGDHSNWDGRITQLRLNPTTATNGGIEIDYIRIVKGELPEDFTPPEDVSNLRATSGNERVTLNWTLSPNTNGDLVDQILYINSDEPISLGALVTSYEATGLSNGLAYTFRITCVDNVLNESSGVTVEAIPRDTTAPEDVTNLTAISGDSRVTLNWVLSINTEGDLADQILYVDNGAGQRIGPLTTTYTVDGLNNGQSYSFRLTCIDEVPNESPGVTIQAIPQSVAAPVVEITSPVDGSITGSATITVSGTINNNSATVTVNGIPAVISSGTFTVDIPLVNEEENEILAIGEFNGQRGYSSITVYRDITPPELEITTPRDGEMVTGYE